MVAQVRAGRHQRQRAYPPAPHRPGPRAVVLRLPGRGPARGVGLTMRLWPKRRAARWGLASLLSVGGVVLAALGTLCVTSGCSSIDYLGQSASRHIRLLAAARPVKDAIADPTTPEALRKRLELTQRMRQFAVTELHEPDNGRYRSYAQLKRSAAVVKGVGGPASCRCSCRPGASRSSAASAIAATTTSPAPTQRLRPWRPTGSRSTSTK